MAKVDILLPYWGDFDLLKIAVDSVFAQTESDWHLYVFDDCYPSKEAELYFKTVKDKRVTYYRHKHNLGITKNFNYAIHKATSPYCVVLGCDDIMLPNYLNRALSTIGPADFYQPGVKVVNAEGVVYKPLADRIKAAIRPKKAGIYKGETLARSIARGNWLYFPSILWKTNAIKKFGFNEGYRIAEDMVLEFELLLSGATMMLDNEVTFHYRRFAKSLSSAEKSKGGVRFSEEDAVYENFANEFAKAGWKKASRAARLRITSRLHKLLSR